MGHVNPSRVQLEGLLESLPMDKPVTMLNLLRFRDTADYADDDRQKPCTGQEAYARYAAVAREKLAVLGAEVVWSGKPQGVLIGPEGDHWNEAFLVRYPTADAFFQMLSMPDYQAATVHRTAALDDSRLIASHDAK